MSPTRAITIGAIVAGAIASAALVSALRPDAGTAGAAARATDEGRVVAASRGPVEVSAERGVPAFAVRFTPEEHGGHRQSWAVVQAPTGLVYVANSDGVLEYDGADWRLIQVPNFRARALAVSADGVVHVGGEGTAGVLAPDSTGALAYREVAGDVELEGATVWAAVPTRRGVLFQAFDRLIAVEGGHVVDVERAPEAQRYHKAFDAGRVAYVRLEGVGLLRYLDDRPDGRLVPVDGGDRLAGRPTRALLDLDGEPGGALLAATDDELFRITPGAAEPFVPVPTEATATLRRARAYHGCAVGGDLPGDRALAITTTAGAVLVVRPDGHVVERIGAASGLTPDDLVLGCATDAQGGLWLALSEAVARVDVGAPLTVFDGRLGLDGAVYAVVRHEGSIYAATGRGVYRLRPARDGHPATFEPVLADGVEIGQAWALLPTADGLLVAATAGIFAVEGLTARSVSSEAAVSLAGLDADTETGSYVGLRDGIGVFRMRGGRWAMDQRIGGIEGEVRSILPVEGGGAWAAEPAGRLLRITEAGTISDAYGPADGVPEGLASVQRIDGHLAVLAADGPYRVDDGAALRVEPMHALTREVAVAVGDVTDGYGIHSDAEEHVWITGREQTRSFRADGAGWADITPDALRRRGGVKGVHTEAGVLWLPTTGGLLRLGGTVGDRYGRGAVAHVRAVASGGADVPITSGAATVRYGQAVRLRFAATAFHDPDRTLYRTQLVGHDQEPGAWSDERFRDYTNLSPGRYAFRVEALTGQGVEARPAVVAVVVPAPWYLSVWAVMLGALLAGVLVAAIAWAASRRYRIRADSERQRADELDRLNAELRHADEVKDLMLANTSHELRTPLTAILGFSEMLAEGDVEDPDEVQELARSMLSGGRRLLHTVNDLLDIARLRSGKVELSPVETDAAEIARRVAAELRPLAASKGLALAVVPPGLSVPATLDPDAFARVITNLVSNGVKFTEAGSVTVAVDAADGDVHLDVTDTGCGMDAEFLPRLFETFEQESTGYGRAAEGSGLGMAITARLVALMDGTIDVASVPGEGTRFHVRIPAEAWAAVVAGDGSHADVQDATAQHPPTTTAP